MGALGVDDEDFWQDPFRDREGVIDRLAFEDAWGIVLDAPSVVRLDLRGDVPLAGARRELNSTGLGPRFHQRAVVVAVRVDANEALAARAFRWKPIARAQLPPADDDDEVYGDAVVTDFFALALRDRIPELPWREGALRVIVLADDERSNAVDVRLEGPPEPDVAVREFVARNRAVGYPRAVNPAPDARAGVPSYRLRADSPPVPAYGVALTVPERVEAAPDARCVVSGAFALPVLEREIVRPFDAHEDRFGALAKAGWVDVGDRDARAVVPVTLLVTSERVDEPAVLRLDVPVYDPVAPGDGGTTVRGHFTVDLFAWPDVPRAPGRYRVWALSGDVLAGPRVIELTGALSDGGA